MAKKKIYAVRKGHKTGLFATWAECQKAVSGYSGAEFRGFTEKEEALAFLNMETTGNVSGDKAKEAAGIVEVPENMVIAYVDGSFEKSIGRYAVFVHHLFVSGINYLSVRLGYYSSS